MECIKLLDKYFIINKQEEIIKILISPDISSVAKNKEQCKEIIHLINKLKKGPIKVKDEEIHFSKNRFSFYYILIATILMIKDLIEYLQKTIKAHEINKRTKKKINDEEVYFDLYFTKKIFGTKNDETSKKAICYILYLLKQYTDSIDLAIDNNLIDDIQFLARNIPEEKLKKKIWLKLFDNERQSKGLSDAKEIIKKSKGIIEIQDILPLMGEDVKIVQFQDELDDCITKYEKSIRELNKEVEDFNESNDLINKDID